MNFFRTIDSHALGLLKILEESKMEHQKQLFQLQKKFEVIFCCSCKFLITLKLYLYDLLSDDMK
jgi:kinesin family member 11